ncbi:hypothetical protein ABB37_02266 [Leptomonas pyrrhocoris]|uniref:Uncharacterized protein n=1 Tax=Leptomonas pyrrhocoris TaxID=157538 RepID=A0A0N0DYJ7_LEPPY|nr:hypothetical protein ABB37_02266 [Leptomonas pyrrhocoris]XP_015662652.1 hypothetical protein ABB37_02266 [Leptomonas pyrrhocoris]KPA84212.1 hypothetical protein ABB37_02266 [Leptomonas pyrrhocoris]KPA84213.1 hypothetical protein ABB37_02266 [Leptomonas pyrrhocoris]|eukprot:XP_015662651.1 hypothetical protein ABB37_02266 [Leptomonas pyrrhocoris]
MPPKRKEEPTRQLSDNFCFADGSIYRGDYSVKQDGWFDAQGPALGSSASPSTAKKHAPAISSSAAGVTVSAPGSTGLDSTIHGYGCLEDASGARYDGEWHNGEMDGIGTLYMPSGGNYTGEFSHHTFHGIGRYTWADGSYYEGEWQRNQMHGTGVYVERTGKRWHGVFSNGSAAKLVARIVL